MDFWESLLAWLIILVCLLVILVVLIQKGRGGGLAGAFGGGGGSSAFGAKTGDVFRAAVELRLRRASLLADLPVSQKLTLAITHTRQGVFSAQGIERSHAVDGAIGDDDLT